MLKKLPSDKISCTKSALLFLLPAPTPHSFTFLNLQFSYELKHKVCYSKAVCRYFHFQFHFIFIIVYIFVQQKVWTL